MDVRRKAALWICPEPDSGQSDVDLSHLISLAEVLAAFINRSEATISNKCAGHARFFSRLRSGFGCSVTSFNSTKQWFSNNWPADLEWPSDITRPKPTKKEAA